jgi:histone H3/H4
MQKKHRAVIRDSIQGITKPAIQRLCKIGGVVRVKGMVYEEVRGILKAYLENIIKNSVASMEYAKRLTLHRQDLDTSLQIEGIFLSAGSSAKSTPTFKSCNLSKPIKVPSETGRKHRFKNGTVALRDVRKLQKNSDCLAIPRLSFSRLVREIGQDFRVDLRFSKKYIELLQLVAETYLINLFRNANLCALHAGRKTVEPKDLQLTRRILGERY